MSTEPKILKKIRVGHQKSSIIGVWKDLFLNMIVRIASKSGTFWNIVSYNEIKEWIILVYTKKKILRYKKKCTDA